MDNTQWKRWDPSNKDSPYEQPDTYKYSIDSQIMFRGGGGSKHEEDNRKRGEAEEI